MLLDFIQIALTLVILVAIVPFFGTYMARVFLREKTLFDPIMKPIEGTIYASIGVSSQQNMTGWQYTRSILYSNFAMVVLVYAIFMLQGILPFNPLNLNPPSWDLAVHTLVAFVTNTDQQHYSGENTFSHASQMLGLGFLMFTSAATGLAAGIAFIRGLTGRALGNFYVDLTLSITRILLPISFIGAVILLILGVPETLAGPANANTLEGATQYIARGAVAHFEIIKELGENGGGYFGVNSAHPFENPNNAANLLETISMVIIPASLIYTYGVIANNKRQGWLLFGMVLFLYVVSIAASAIGEYLGNPAINDLIGQQAPNLEGKEVRFGWAQTTLWAVTTTATMCGAVSGMHDSLMPPAGFVAIFNLFVQAIWGGQGTGTAYLFVYLILTVFITGLMVGRTPEFLRRKIEKQEIVLASIILLVHPILILIPGAIALFFAHSGQELSTLAGISNPGFHGISQVLYEYASAAANNGSGFEGLGDANTWWNLSASVSMLGGRYLPITALLLLADGMYRKHPVPETAGTLHTDTTLFASVTAGIILILGALTFLPVLALGPIGEAIKIY